MSVRRIYVEKKPAFAVEAQQLLHEIRHILLIKSVTGLRIINRYDVEGIADELYQQCLPVVFSEPQMDNTFTALPEADAVFAVEYLPGQFDQRADSCEECIQLLGRCELALQAAKMLAEYDLGKPVQTMDIQADVEADAKVSVIETMSLSKRGTAMKKALEAYEQGKATK